MTEQQREAILSAIKEIDAIAAHNAGYFPVDAPGQPEIHELCGKVEGALAAISHAEGEAPNVYWVLFDATADKKFIKKSLDDGSLAFFDTEQEAFRAKARHTGTDYMRVEYYKHPAPQVVFSDTQEEIEARLADQLENSCPYYLGSGHKDDVAAPQVAVPDGWKLVPVEPTPAMLADFDGWREYDIPDNWADAFRRPYGSWRAMLAAAPTAPAGEQPVSDPDGLLEHCAEFLERLQVTRIPEGSSDFEEAGSLIGTIGIRRTAPAPDEREIAALRDVAKAAQDFCAYEHSKESHPHSVIEFMTVESALRDAVRRLRAGKEGADHG